MTATAHPIASRSITSSARPRPAAYAAEATAYDRRTVAFQSFRDRIVAALPLTAGDRVLDVACGTGLCFEGLENAVGPTGEVVGVDESPAMTAIAAERAARSGWDNVRLITARADQALVEGQADAALFCAAHDVMQSPDALRNVMAHLRPGAWIAAGGGKFASAWLVGLNLQVRALHEPYVTDFTGFDRPWTHLQGLVPNLRVEEFAFGTGYCAVGQVR